MHTRSLSAIERVCWPWHYLFEAFPPIITMDYFVRREEVQRTRHEHLPPQPLVWDAPSIRNLNEDTGTRYNPAGVENTTPLDLARVNADGSEELLQTGEYDQERGLTKMYNAWSQ